MNARLWLFALIAAPLAGAQPPAPAGQAPVPAAAPAPAPAASPAPASAPQADVPSGPEASDATSYLFGVTFGEQLRRVGITNEVLLDALLRGFKEGLDGRRTTPAEQQQLQQFVRSVVAASTARNRAAARDFLARNGREKGVKTTASGLQYKVLVPGNLKSPSPMATDEVTVNYRGRLLDGTEFDSTYARGAPAPFRVNGVIKGWQEGLTLMKPGARYEFFVPPELAYDASARPGIPAGSLLIFEVDLLSVGTGGTPAVPRAPATPHGPTPPPAPTQSPNQ